MNPIRSKTKRNKKK